VSPRGLVLHSAEERSTAFIEKECYFYETARHFTETPETRDIIIPLLVAGWGDVGAIRETLRRAYGVESWRLYETGTGAPKEKDSAGIWEARVPSGGLQECISAPDPIALHGKIRDRVQAEGKQVEVFGLVPAPAPKPDLGKRYRVTPAIGKARHVVNFHDGVKTHADGSPFFDVEICGNLQRLYDFTSDLREAGYSLI